jgi:predicted dehydrogenase
MGKHLLLEKPIALSTSDAAELAAAVEAAGVASVVFFTSQFTPEGRAWLSSLAPHHWESGTARWLGNAFAAGSPFDTPWRRAKGGLWDVGPHTLAMLTAALGPITSVQATAGVRDLVHLLLRHEGGATSTASVTLTAPDAATDTSLELWGPAGWTRMPSGPRERVGAARTALGELMAAAGASSGGRPPQHPLDAQFGAHIVGLLAEAQRQVDAAATAGSPPAGVTGGVGG